MGSINMMHDDRELSIDYSTMSAPSSFDTSDRPLVLHTVRARDAKTGEAIETTTELRQALAITLTKTYKIDVYANDEDASESDWEPYTEE